MIEGRSIELEKTVLVGIINSNQNEEKSKEYLAELKFLTFTAGGEVVKSFTQKLDFPNPKTFIGSGKIIELLKFVKGKKISSVIFDDELTPTQQGNIEKLLKVKILDRTGLILDIFAQRARTSYARTQVELAQYQYLLPRLKGLWTHLERQRGGIGMRGPGETEIETDRRIVRNKISLLKNKLEIIDKQMATQRGNRGSLVRVSLVGYTNVGKSTLMNVISKSKVFSEEKLLKCYFKDLPNNIKIIPSDSQISTFSILKLIDYCITVRGTIGIEAACLGIPVITAGTGRYEDYGFTHNSTNKNIYLSKLRGIDKLPKLRQSQLNALAFAYVSLFTKQIQTNVIDFKFLKNKSADLKVTVNNDSEGEDIQLISNWLESNNEDLLN